MTPTFRVPFFDDRLPNDLSTLPTSDFFPLPREEVTSVFSVCLTICLLPRVIPHLVARLERLSCQARRPERSPRSFRATRSVRGTHSRVFSPSL